MKRVKLVVLWLSVAALLGPLGCRVESSRRETASGSSRQVVVRPTLGLRGNSSSNRDTGERHTRQSEPAPARDSD